MFSICVNPCNLWQTWRPDVKNPGTLLLVTGIMLPQSVHQALNYFRRHAADVKWVLFRLSTF